jgi:DNA-binding NtrC family response regulator
MGNWKIMVIDDENVIGKMLKINFERDKYDVVSFTNAEPAIELLRKEPYDLVITDLKMKGIDGMEVLRIIKSEMPSTKVIMITAFANLNAAVEAFRGKVDDFFPKPVKIKDLKERVKLLLGVQDD